MQVVWTRPALRQLNEIQDYIAQDSPAAAYRVALELTTRAENVLSANPMAGRLGRVAGSRELVLTNLPYILAYRVTQQVEILAAIHTAQDWPTKFG